MSGPKAIRVTSREERIAQCENLLAQLDAQASEWRRVCDGLGLLSDQDRSGLEAKVSLLRQLLAEDDFQRVERQAIIVTEFLYQDLEERVTKHLERKRRDKIVRRRLRIAAEQTLFMAKAGGQHLDPTITKILESAAEGSIGDNSQVEKSINQVVATLASLVTSRSLTDDQRRLAEELQGNAKVQTITDWVVTNAKFDDDLATRVDGYIADLEVSGESTIASQFLRRVEEIRAVANPISRRMLLDTLIIDLASEVKQQKRRANLYKIAVALKSIIDKGSDSAMHGVLDGVNQLLSRWDAVDFSTAEQILNEANAATEKWQKERAARSRRSAILEAFSQLGYEIREGMETAWVHDKRFIVHKSGQLDHGVEVSGSAERGMLQVRPVRFGAAGSSADRQRDMDIETIWCSELGRLQQILGEKGGKIAIERAKAVGETPVKVVPIPEMGSRRSERAKPHTKKLPLE